MAASSRRLSLSPSPAPSPRATPFNIWTPLDYLPAQLASSRKRPSHTQLQRLQAAFDASPYITKEERSTLAYEIGLYVDFSIAPCSIKPYASPWIQGRQIYHRMVSEQTPVRQAQGMDQKRPREEKGKLLSTRRCCALEAYHFSRSNCVSHGGRAVA
jgi:hypothetical protein